VVDPKLPTIEGSEPSTKDSRKPNKQINHRTGVLTVRFLLSILALVAVGAVAACGGDDNSASNTPTRASTASTTPAATGTPTAAATGAETIDVALQEWSINPSVLTIGAGAVSFTVKNTGPQFKHEFVVLKTDLAPAALPKKADGTVDEEGPGVTSPGEIADIPIGQQQSTTIDLTPGKYLFICNLVDQDTNGTELHFTNGMFRAFTVQ
jgi:uncharacterized cupredoxin-like copper-binding protein